ncbi:type IV pili methyl-accepting chemotaxis transducer N-terminal domain-containing protein [Helicobacter sp. UBA3407]|uniref:type IV pili methyl-accepting chemotaxis transducer N-terminal domain-containing protein n=1 Tax=Helicobacter TaxID=209 RepID=UPI0026359D38|nr:type IV pili methyl-accepting chemotaxis transducer N-terminal domain-containing protein [Helicobacter sp. UBA3407]
MTKIVTRLIILGILTTFCVGVMILSVIFINQLGIQDGYIINIAGKERMLTQKITKEIFLINSQNSQDYTALNLALEEFENNLNTLRFGNPQKNINPPTKTTIITKLEAITTQWTHFKTIVEDFKSTSSKLYEDRKFLDENNIKMLFLSDNIVKAMVESKMPAHLIDDSGRQRMLTQRMAYLMTRYFHIWDDKSYRAFKESHALYHTIITNFYQNANYKHFPKLAKSIQEAYEFWQTYSKHIDNVLNLQEHIVEDLKQITSQNTAILNEIDWTVNLYSDISIHQRAYLEKFQYVAAFIMILLGFYSIYNLLNIRAHLGRFLQKTKLLASGKLNQNLTEAIQLEGESELSQASQNLSHFLQSLEQTKETSKQAIHLSELISEEIENISEEIRHKLAFAKISEERRKSIEDSINLSEDIAIQSSEQLIITARLLDKLHRILKEIESYC